MPTLPHPQLHTCSLPRWLSAAAALTLAAGGARLVVMVGAAHGAPVQLAGSSTVEGGPFQRVVYNVKTHIALAVPGLFREGTLQLKASAIRYNDLSQTAWTDGACSIVDGPSSATAAAATADWTHRTVSMNGGVHFTLTPSGGGSQQVQVSLNCPSLRYAASTRDVQCSGGVQLTLGGSSNGRPLNAAISSPMLQYQSSTGAMECSGGVHLSLQNSGGAGPSAVTIACPTLHYASDNGLVRCTGGVQLNLSTGGAQPSSAAVSCPSVEYNSASGIMVCMGGVRFSLQTANPGQTPVTLALSCSSLRFDAGTGIVQSGGGVSGQVYGISGIPGGSVPSVAIGPTGAPTVSAPDTGGNGPVSIRAAGMTYNSQAHVLDATGGVHLAQRDTSIQCQSLTLDTAHRILRMAGDFHYQDGSGKHLQGSSAAEDLNQRFVTVTGPVSFTDAKGNSVQSQTATLDQKTRTTTFSGTVHLADSQGVDVNTTFVSIQSVSNGPERIQVGPLRFRSQKSL